MKVCVRCKKEKQSKEYCKNNRYKNSDGLNRVCRECNRIYAKYYNKKNREKLSKIATVWNKKNREKHLSYKRKSHMKYREKNNKRRSDGYNTSRGIWFSINSLCRNKKRKAKMIISVENFVSWYDTTPKNCFYCDIPQELAKTIDRFSRHGQYKRLSIDRINSDKNYEIGNLALACFVCNAVKQDVLTMEQMKEVGQRFIKPIWQTIVAGKN